MVLTIALACHRFMSPAATIELTRIRPPPLNSVRFFTEEPTTSSPHVVSPSPHTFEEYDESSAIHPPWKRHLYQLLEQPKSSTAAFIMHMFTTSLIVMSAFVTVLETVPAVHSISTRIWFGVETSVVALFTVEYVSRLLAWSNTWSSLFHWVFCTFILVV
jgi:potassium voltage-gated channel Shal-related subfamily D protein 2